MTSRPPLSTRLRQWPLFSLVGVQLPACVPVVLLLLLHPDLGLGSAVIVQATTAAMLSRLLRQPRWWLPVHLLFTPALAVLLHAGVPSWWYLVALLGCLLLFGGAWRGNVPLFISSQRALAALDTLLPQGEHLHFADVGCGSGAVLAQVRRLRPGWRLTGIESAWLPWLWARLRLLGQSDTVVSHANFWSVSLAHVDVVYAYLSPTPMLALLRKLEQDGCRYLISYRFTIPGAEPDHMLELEDGSRLYRWDLRKLHHES